MSLFCQIGSSPLLCGRMKDEDKKRTIQAYDAQAASFSEKFTAMSAARAPYLDRFFEVLPGKRVIDIGAGDGSASAYLEEKGAEVVAIDLSEAMVDIMKSRGLDAHLMDMEHMDFPRGSFDGVLALCSLMNLPKADMKPVIERIADMLSRGGVFGSFITKGEGEGMEKDPRYEGVERWFSWYSFDEFKEMLSPYFEILVMEDSPTPARAWIYTLAKKK
jgi:SAM-dependent methyltransferase